MHTVGFDPILIRALIICKYPRELAKWIGLLPSCKNSYKCFCHEHILSILETSAILVYSTMCMHVEFSVIIVPVP